MKATRALMVVSAVLLGILGVGATFLPEELLRRTGAQPSDVLTIMIQLLGALYLGFAGLNYMMRNTPIGGIYSRPVVLGNLLHFVPASFALIRAMSRTPGQPLLWGFTGVYVVLALAFAILLFRHPGPQEVR